MANKEKKNGLISAPQNVVSITEYRNVENKDTNELETVNKKFVYCHDIPGYKDYLKKVRIR